MRHRIQQLRNTVSPKTGDTRQSRSSENDFLSLPEDVQSPEHRWSAIRHYPSKKQASPSVQGHKYEGLRGQHTDEASTRQHWDLPNEELNAGIHTVGPRRSRSPFITTLPSFVTEPCLASPNKTIKARSRSPVRLNMSRCPPKLEWEKRNSPAKPQKTAPTWLTSWWPKNEEIAPSGQPDSFVSSLISKNSNAREVLKEFTHLKVRLATARAPWLSCFLAGDGLERVTGIAENVSRAHASLCSAIRFEFLNVLRILLNTELGFEAIMSSIVTLASLCRIAKEGDDKSKVLSFDLLAEICMSSTSGSRPILQSFVDSASGPSSSRFSWLTNVFLAAQNQESQSNELIRAALTLANAIVTIWPEKEGRIALHQELFGQLPPKLRPLLAAKSVDIKVQLDKIDSAARCDKVELHITGFSPKSSCTNVGSLEAICKTTVSSLCTSLSETASTEIRRSETGSMRILDQSEEGYATPMPYTSMPQDVVNQHSRSCRCITIDTDSDSLQKPQRDFAPDLESCRDAVSAFYESDILAAGSDDFGVKVDHASAESLCMRQASITALVLEDESPRKYPRMIGGMGTSSACDIELGDWLKHKGQIDRTSQNCDTFRGRFMDDPSRDYFERDLPIHKDTKENINFEDLDHCSIGYCRRSPPTGCRPPRSLSSVTEVSIRDVSQAGIENVTRVSLERERSQSRRSIAAKLVSEPPLTDVKASGIETVLSGRTSMACSTEKLSIPLITTETNSARSSPMIRSVGTANDVAAGPQKIHRDRGKHAKEDADSLFPSPSTSPSPSTPLPPPFPPPLNLPGLPLYFSLRKTDPLPAAFPSSRKAPLSSKRLKPLLWQKLSSEKLVGSIWTSVANYVDHGLHQELMLSDLERFFSSDTIAEHCYSPSPFQNNTKPSRKISLIDRQRAKNIEVMLARIKLTYKEIASCLLSLDDWRLGTDDQLRIMLRNVPTEQEVSSVEAYRDNPSVLGNAERFILEIAHVPLFEIRLAALIFRRNFDCEIAEIIPVMETLGSACAEVMSCKTLPEFLALALTAGNILNGSTFRGNAEGFHLDALIRLGEIRSSSEAKTGSTLLHYLVAIMQKTRSSVAWELRKDLEHCSAAARISSQTVLENVANLETGLRAIENALTSSHFTTPGDLFVASMSVFVTRTKDTVAQIVRSASELKEQITRVIQYFGEDTNKARTEDIFSTLRAFVDLVNRAQEENFQLSGNHILRSMLSASALPSRLVSQKFDDTTKGMRAGRAIDIRKARDRLASRV